MEVVGLPVPHFLQEDEVCLWKLWNDADVFLRFDLRIVQVVHVAQGFPLSVLLEQIWKIVKYEAPVKRPLLPGKSLPNLPESRIHVGHILKLAQEIHS
jgi:hypothetical protein